MNPLTDLFKEWPMPSTPTELFAQARVQTAYRDAIDELRRTAGDDLDDLNNRERWILLTGIALGYGVALNQQNQALRGDLDSA